MRILLSIIFIIMFVISSFITGTLFGKTYFNLSDNTINNDLQILKKIEKEIIIPYKFVYVRNKKLIDYEIIDDGKNGKKILKKEINEKKIDKKYNDKLEKQNYLYDYFFIDSTKYDINIDSLNKYDFTTLLETFSMAPYFDDINNTLYIFSHSSGKYVNPGQDFYKLETGNEVEFYDIDTDKIDTFIIKDKKILKKDDFNNNYFLQQKNKIVLVTCYPLNSNEKRLVISLEKK